MTLTVIGPTSAAALGAAVMEGAAAAWIALAAAEAEGIALSRQTVKMALLRDAPSEPAPPAAQPRLRCPRTPTARQASS
jgi:hypothetical protein